MRCNYPNCLKPALWTPVVALPTLRSVGVIKPQLHPIALDEKRMAQMGLRSTMIVRQYESLLNEYNRVKTDMIKTDEPTYLLGKEVCQKHKDTYNFFNWFRRSEWGYLREAARAHGYELPTPELLVVQFRPVGWLPQHGSLELVRDRMAKED